MSLASLHSSLKSVLRSPSLALACASALAACASRPPDTPAVPSWVRQSARTEDAGSLAFVESDDDVDPKAAAEKAEALAYLDAANECSFVPKGARFDGRYEAKTGHLHQIHVRLRVEHSACDSAKKAYSPDAIRAQADPGAFAAIARFHQKNGEPDLAAAGGDEAKSLLIARQKLAVIKQKIAASAPARTDAAPASAVTALARDIAKLWAEAQGLGAVSLAWSQVRHELMRPKFGADGTPVVAPRPPGRSDGAPARKSSKNQGK